MTSPDIDTLNRTYFSKRIEAHVPVRPLPPERLRTPIGIAAAPTVMVQCQQQSLAPALVLRQRIEALQVSLNENVAQPTDASLQEVHRSVVNLRTSLQSAQQLMGPFSAERRVARGDETRLVNAFIDYAQLAEQECNEIILEIEERQRQCQLLDQLLQLIRTKGEKADLGNDPATKELIDRARELGVKIDGYGWKNKTEKEVWMENIRSVRSQCLATNDIAHIKLKRATSIYERGMMTATSLMASFDKIWQHIIRNMGA
jgi:hypothetical protein